jgi:hypothetical protein
MVISVLLNCLIESTTRRYDQTRCPWRRTAMRDGAEEAFRHRLPKVL